MVRRLGSDAILKEVILLWSDRPVRQTSVDEAGPLRASCSIGRVHFTPSSLPHLYSSSSDSPELLRCTCPTISPPLAYTPILLFLPFILHILLLPRPFRSHLVTVLLLYWGWWLLLFLLNMCCSKTFPTHTGRQGRNCPNCAMTVSQGWPSPYGGSACRAVFRAIMCRFSTPPTAALSISL